MDSWAYSLAMISVLPALINAAIIRLNWQHLGNSLIQLSDQFPFSSFIKITKYIAELTSSLDDVKKLYLAYYETAIRKEIPNLKKNERKKIRRKFTEFVSSSLIHGQHK